MNDWIIIVSNFFQGGGGMRKLTLALVLAAAITNISYSETYEIHKGWNLIGAACKLPVSSLNNQNVLTVWKWNNDHWMAYSPNHNIQQCIENFKIPTFNQIDALYWGWIKASDNVTIKTEECNPPIIPNPFLYTNVDGDKVFDFYDDFNGEKLDASKWEKNSACYSGTGYVENGILWLVPQSYIKGCNVKARGINIKYNDQKVIEANVLIDYVCGDSNDGDGFAIAIDSAPQGVDTGCSKSFTANNAIYVAIFNDMPSGEETNGVGIYDKLFDDCKLEGIVTQPIPDKKDDLSNVTLSVALTGSNIKVWIDDLNPANGLHDWTMETQIWNPDGNGYLYFGAGTGYSGCPETIDDSAHGMNWVRVRKYSDSVSVVNGTLTLDSPVVVKNTGSEDLRDFQIKVMLPSTPQSHFYLIADIDTDPQNGYLGPVYYCYEQQNGECSATEITDTLWLKIPVLPAGQSVNVYRVKMKLEPAEE